MSSNTNNSYNILGMFLMSLAFVTILAIAFSAMSKMKEEEKNREDYIHSITAQNVYKKESIDKCQDSVKASLDSRGMTFKERFDVCLLLAEKNK